MRIFLLLCALLAGDLARAGLVFEKTTMDTQPAVTDAEVSVRYAFRNTGAGPVRITAVQSDCSCTIPTVAKDRYAPGEAGEVVVKFEIGSRHGPQRKTVIVSTDDAARPVQTLILSAALPEVLKLSATSLLWAAGEGPAMKTITVKTTASPEVTELRARAQSTALRVAVERVSGTEFRVQVTPAPNARNITSALYFEAVLAAGPAKRSTVFLRVR